jgi:hypothetical protein
MTTASMPNHSVGWCSVASTSVHKFIFLRLCIIWQILTTDCNCHSTPLPWLSQIIFYLLWLWNKSIQKTSLAMIKSKCIKLLQVTCLFTQGHTCINRKFWLEQKRFVILKCITHLIVGISKIGFLDILPETLDCLKDTRVSFKLTQFDRVSFCKGKSTRQTNWQRGIAKGPISQIAFPSQTLLVG